MGLSAIYLLDTNILSELAKREPCATVERRLAAHQFQCAVSATTIEELAFGIHRLPLSPKRDMLDVWLDRMLNSLVLLSYDHYCALWLGRERARLATSGKPAPRADGETAAIAAVNELVLVTQYGGLREFLQAAPGKLVYLTAQRRLLVKLARKPSATAFAVCYLILSFCPFILRLALKKQLF